jgi:hypothetical protein
MTMEGQFSVRLLKVQASPLVVDNVHSNPGQKQDTMSGLEHTGMFFKGRLWSIADSRSAATNGCNRAHCRHSNAQTYDVSRHLWLQGSSIRLLIQLCFHQLYDPRKLKTSESPDTQKISAVTESILRPNLEYQLAILLSENKIAIPP